MNIIDIVQFYSPLSGGVKRYINDKIDFLSDCSEHTHSVIIPSNRTRTVRRQNSCIYEICSPRLIGSKSYRMLISKKSIMDFLRANRPDVIEVGDPYRSAWIALDAGRSLHVPVVAVYHSDYPRALDRTFRRFGGAVAGKLFATTIERYLVRLYNSMAATVVLTKRFFEMLHAMNIRGLVHLPLGTNPSVFYPRKARQQLLHELGLAPEVVLLVYAGRLAREKNILQLLAMMNNLRTCFRPVHLLIVGDGELRKEVLYRVATQKDTSWMPYIDDAHRLADIYSSADLFVHAGVSETFGLSALEAQACGTRVLAVHNSGMDEIIEGEMPPITAGSAHPGALAEAVKQCMCLNESDTVRRDRRNRILINFTVEKTFTQLLNLYTTVVNHTTSARAYANKPPKRFERSGCHQTLPTEGS